MRDNGTLRTALTWGNGNQLECASGTRGKGETVAGDDFAELLRTLKERSGLSYGVLGKRLHMSASTLHRYVNGDVVPVEYAPVERLARLCRATPDELLELHRRWVRADALRGVKGEPAAGASEEPEAPAGSVTSAASAASAAPAASEAPDAPTASAAAAASEAPAAAAGSAGAGTPAGWAAAKAQDVPGGSEPTESDVSDLQDPVTSLTPSAPRRRPRRTAVLAGGGVVAVATVALLVSLLPGDGERGTGATKGAAATVSADSSVSASHPTRKASKSASASPSPTASGKRTATPKATSSRAGGTNGSGNSGGVPLAVTTNPYYWDAPCEQHFLLDRKPENVPPPPVQQNVVGWVTPFDGVAADSQTVSLAVQGTGPETVVLRELHVRVVSSNPPLGWSRYAMGIGCGGTVNTKSFDVSLDQGDPLAMPIGGQRNFPYRVSESDPEVFYVTAHTSGHDVRWYLEMDWSSGNRKGTIRIDNHGQPFRTSAGEKSYYGYALTGDGGWERVENED